MAIYRYKAATLIERVDISSSRPGVVQATLTATANANGAQLEELRKKLGAHGYSTLMDTSEGLAVIQVRGLKDEKSFISVMEKLDLTHNGVEKDLVKTDEKQPGFRERVRNKSVFLSAIFYDIGNIAFIISGIQRGRHNPGGKFTANNKSEVMTGVAFSVGDLLMTFYGDHKSDEELNAADWGLKRHLHKKGIEVPIGSDLNPDTLHQNGVVKATDRWLRKHIIHIKCLSELAGGLFTVHAGMERDKNGMRNNGKLTAGFLITTGWLSTFLLEKPPGHAILGDNKDLGSSLLPNAITDQLPQVLVDNPRGWIARPSAMANNAANLWGSLNPKTGERVRLKNSVSSIEAKIFEGHPEALEAFRSGGKKGADKAILNIIKSDPAKYNPLMKEMSEAFRRRNDYAWNVVSACSFLVAHTLFGLSGSKRPTETEDDKAMLTDLVLLSANVLARQPEAVRAASLEETADYVSKLSHVKMTKEQVQEVISQKVSALAQSTWAGRVQKSSGPAVGQQMTV